MTQPLARDHFSSSLHKHRPMHQYQSDHPSISTPPQLPLLLHRILLHDRPANSSLLPHSLLALAPRRQPRRDRRQRRKRHIRRIRRRKPRPRRPHRRRKEMISRLRLQECSLGWRWAVVAVDLAERKRCGEACCAGWRGGGWGRLVEAWRLALGIWLGERADLVEVVFLGDFAGDVVAVAPGAACAWCGGWVCLTVGSVGCTSCGWIWRDAWVCVEAR
jgi:hypothetical protein